MKKLCLLAILLLSGCAHNQPLSVDLQGHRGARGLLPENSIPAFEECIEQGMTTLELDTNLTADGQLIVYHDDVINPTLCLNGDGQPAEPIPVRQLSVDQLKRYDCGAIQHPKFPTQQVQPGLTLITLDEFFEWVLAYDGELGFNVELKFAPQADEAELREAAAVMAATLQRHGVSSRTIVQSFRPEVLPMVRALDQEVRLSALFQPSDWQGLQLILGLPANSHDILEQTIAAGADTISPHYLYVKPRYVRRCREAGIEVIPWTVNDKPTMRRMLRYGVDGIISDYPDRLAEVYSDWARSKQPQE